MLGWSSLAEVLDFGRLGVATGRFDRVGRHVQKVREAIDEHLLVGVACDRLPCRVSDSPVSFGEPDERPAVVRDI